MEVRQNQGIRRRVLLLRFVSSSARQRQPAAVPLSQCWSGRAHIRMGVPRAPVRSGGPPSLYNSENHSRGIQAALSRQARWVHSRRVRQSNRGAEEEEAAGVAVWVVWPFKAIRVQYVDERPTPSNDDFYDETTFKIYRVTMLEL